MTPLSSSHFSAGYGLLLDYFGRTNQAQTIAAVFHILMTKDPSLTSEQFDYMIQECMLNCTFMPKLNEMLLQLYEQDTSKAPALPDIDPRYADSYQQSTYWRAVDRQEKWLAANQIPDLQTYRADKQIPGISGTTKPSLLSAF